MSLVAHGIGGVKDLPVPGWLFLYGAALVLVLSFVALGALWRRPVLAERADGRPLPPWLRRAVSSPWLTVPLRTLAAFLLVVVFVAALRGTTVAERNLAPTFVYVVFWLGLVPVTVVLGDVYRVLNPWRAWADLAVWLYERSGREARPLSSYPERLGRWPAAVLLGAFAALELAYVDPSSPRVMSVAVAVYTYITFLGMAAYGRETWLARGEGFAVYFSLLARIAPFGRRGDGTLVVRAPLAGLARRDDTPGTLAFVAVMLGSVGFDGLSRTSLWLDLTLDARGSDVRLVAANLAGLVGTVLLVAGAYLAAVGLARRLTGADASLRDELVLSLVPIALVYVVAHYFSLLIVQGRYAVPLASDPLGHGWDLFGTADVRPGINPLSPNTVWYAQVAALVTGHVAGLTLAHDRALAVVRPVSAALRSQYPMLLLMVGYTVGGLWLLAQS